MGGAESDLTPLEPKPQLVDGHCGSLLTCCSAVGGGCWLMSFGGMCGLARRPPYWRFHVLRAWDRLGSA